MSIFNFTREEKQVVLFLIIVAVAGIAANCLVKKYSGVKTIAQLCQDFGKVDLNTASKELLQSVPGIGEKLACRIIEYRQRQAPFKEVADLKQIKGVTDYRYRKFKDSFLVK
ncbi:MAG: hypothetical protein A3K83_06305 [Omnitrophica WOR_2 bacterium RBG_13_44_8b]|nr:MAG: hypothetical protein A3K83_06305 [Omnitrophica WOR_2 bacterium RBG_13_44_8b]